jgi:hypothetical protein
VKHGSQGKLKPGEHDVVEPGFHNLNVLPLGGQKSSLSF